MSAVARTKDKVLDRFEVVGQLGRGAGSSILHIRDPQSGQHFAMKVVIRRTADEQKFLDQAKHEYEIAQRLEHPSLVKIYDIRVIRRWFREREVRTLLEYVNGHTIEQLNLSVPAIVLVFAEVAAAVSYMHGRDVFHADLKPNNIMVTRSGRVKVIDFGLAWLRGEQRRRVQGTMGYLAPEQVKLRVVTEATDVFNLGAAMYRMLTGQSVSGIAADTGSRDYVPSHTILKDAHEVNAQVPAPLSDLVGRCCAEKPKNRPKTMAAVAEELRQVMQAMNVADDDLATLVRQGQSQAT